jgi:hypothetical protein
MEFQREIENKAERYLERVPNQELLEHERKRKIELRCIELQDSLEEEGYVSAIFPAICLLFKIYMLGLPG